MSDDDDDDFSEFRTPGGKEAFLTPKHSKKKQKRPVTKIVKGASAEFLERLNAAEDAKQASSTLLFLSGVLWHSFTNPNPVPTLYP